MNKQVAILVGVAALAVILAAVIGRATKARRSK